MNQNAKPSLLPAYIGNQTYTTGPDCFQCPNCPSNEPSSTNNLLWLWITLLALIIIGIVALVGCLAYRSHKANGEDRSEAEKLVAQDTIQVEVDI